MAQSIQPIMLIVGFASAHFIYLIKRYAEKSGYEVLAAQAVPSSFEVRALQPAAVLFPSMGILESTQELVGELVNCEIPVLVCSTSGDEERARDLGADYCLVHPLTYDIFLNAMQVIH